MSFMDQKRFVVSEEEMNMVWGGGFHCRLCGRKFRLGDGVRFVLMNNLVSKKGTKFTTGNLLVCDGCDGEDVRERAQESFDLALKLYKQWQMDRFQVKHD